jgi:hypothetical protein
VPRDGRFCTLIVLAVTATLFIILTSAFVRSINDECLLGEGQRRRALHEFVEHRRCERITESLFQ